MQSMNRYLRYKWASAILLGLSVSAEAAPKVDRLPRPRRPHIQSVPEIDAAAGLLALAAVATMLLFAWERSRRQQVSQKVQGPHS
jgi:hypothetical protein